MTSSPYGGDWPAQQEPVDQFQPANPTPPPLSVPPWPVQSEKKAVAPTPPIGFFRGQVLNFLLIAEILLVLAVFIAITIWF